MTQRNKNRTGYKKTEIGWIPKEWHCMKLGSEEEPVLQVIRNGLTVKQDRQSGNYKVTRIETISDGEINLSKVQYVTDVPTNIAQAYLIRKGDILFSHINSESHLGKTAIATQNYPDLLHGMNLLLFRVNPNKIAPEFLNFLFIFYRRLGVFRKYSSRAVNQSSLNQEVLKSLIIPLPTLPEQQRIIQILSTWDRAIERVQRLIEAKQRQKKGLMQGLLTGRLRFPEFGEPAEEMGKIPNGWKVVEFHDCATRSKKKIDPVMNDFNFRCVELEHISQETGKIIGETESKQQTSTKNYFRPGNVLFGKLRPYLHKFAYCYFEGVCSSEIWVLQTKSICTSRYLFYLVQTDTFLSASIQTTGTKMPRSDWSVVRKAKFALPALEEQERIVVLLDQVELNIELLERYVMQLKQQKKGLMQKLLTGEIRVKVD